MRTRSAPRKPLILLSALVVGSLSLAGLPAVAAAAAPAQHGTTRLVASKTSSAPIVAAISGDPTTLDSGVNTGALTIYVAQNIFEQLFALDKNFTVRPMLASGYKLSSDRKTYTITLRKGISFQNGQAMTSADVKASLERWEKVSSNGQATAKNIASIGTPTPTSITVALDKPSYSFIGELAQQVQAAIILPASVATAAGIKPLTDAQTIGTGPYKLKSYTSGQSVVLSKYTGYKSLTKNWGGLAGAKHAYAKSITYKFVTDASQRLSGLETGQWDWVDAISADDETAASQNTALTVKPAATGMVSTLLLNHNSKSIFANQDARLALNAVVDKKAIASATFGSSDLWSPLEPAMVIKSNKAMYTTVGSKVFNTHSKSKAKSLFKKAGVTSSSTVRILTTQTYPQFYQEATIIQGELKAIGIKATLSVYDFPTMIQKLSSDPTGWDMSMTDFDGGVTAPSQVLWLGSTWPGQYSDATMSSLVASYEDVTTPAAALKVVKQIQSRIYKTMPEVQMGAVLGTGIYSTKLTLPGKWTNVLWNAKLAG